MTRMICRVAALMLASTTTLTSCSRTDVDGKSEPATKPVVPVATAPAEDGSASVPDKADELTGEAADVLALLEQAPSWWKAGCMCPEAELQRVEAAIRGIAEHDLDAIRTAMIAYSVGAGPGCRLDRSSTLLILNKFLFALPERIDGYDPAASTFGGAWLGVPVYEENGVKEVGLLWPWSLDEQGEIHLTGRPFSYTGPVYNAVGMFDYYRSRFGPRH